ncbi:MAG: hypothetical protein KDB16_02345 [Acidimicrobiales bacterium]|nr:hypothetical protein [Acidimicrobiales bacterium]
MSTTAQRRPDGRRSQGGARSKAKGRRKVARSNRWWWQPTPATRQIPMGLAWFGVMSGAMWLGMWPVAMVLGVVSAVAGYQLGASWIEAGRRADAYLAALVCGLSAPAAAVHTAAVGALLIAGVVVTLLGASVQRTMHSSPVEDAGFTIQSWLAISIASASFVLVYRYEVGAAVWLLSLSAIYDAGHYLIGAGSPQFWEGPVAGAIGVAVVSFALVSIGVPPLDEAAGLRFGAAAVVLMPAGVILAGLLLPRADVVAPALRRIDSLLCLAPIWAFFIGRYIESISPTL